MDDNKGIIRNARDWWELNNSSGMSLCRIIVEIVTWLSSKTFWQRLSNKNYVHTL